MHTVTSEYTNLYNTLPHNSLILSNESFVSNTFDLKSDLISRQNTIQLFRNVKTFLRLFNYVEQNEYRVVFCSDVCTLITSLTKNIFHPNSLLYAHDAQLPTTSLTWFYHSAVAETL